MAKLQDTKFPLIIISGPTGIGKTQMALDLAAECGGEIISADSMQVYRYMDIGTSKPTPRERARVKHHLIDIVDPDEAFNAALYASLAAQAIEIIMQRQRPVFVVGGTGLYIRALLGGIVTAPGPDEKLRAFYKEELRCHGKAHLYHLLQGRDEKAARRIAPHDTVRIIRALEVWDTCGRSIVEKQQDHQFGDTRYCCLKIGLTAPRREIYERIERRTEKMMDAGLVGEVENLLARGYPASLKPMQSLGYKHMVNYLTGVYDRGEAVRLMKRDTRNYAKRQLSWFRRDSEIQWFARGDVDAVRKLLQNYLTSEGYKYS